MYKSKSDCLLEKCRDKSPRISTARLNSLCSTISTYPEFRNLDHSWEGKTLTTACESHVLLRTLSAVYRADGPAICGFCGDGQDDGCRRLQDFLSLGWYHVQALISHGVDSYRYGRCSKVLILGTVFPDYTKLSFSFTPRYVCNLRGRCISRLPIECLAQGDREAVPGIRRKSVQG